MGTLDERPSSPDLALSSHPPLPSPPLTLPRPRLLSPSLQVSKGLKTFDKKVDGVLDGAIDKMDGIVARLQGARERMPRMRTSFSGGDGYADMEFTNAE